MTPERLRQIEELFHAARERAPSERRVFLAEACAGDPALRREVESLLGQQPAGVIDTPVAALAASLIPDTGPRLEPGFTLGPYRIESLIGVGGMGEVYRARDLTLGRDVAIKVLPRHFTIDPERLARFAREARLLAALNHPNIAAIYGVEEGDDVRALVLELVDGPTLADLLASGPLPIAEALRIARQVAEALAAAHEKGIIHRDLKPANIALTPDGVAKLLDFGLGRTDVGAAALPRAGAPTLTLDATRHGLIVGTAAYMSPEQARGKTVDKRTDIWSFGCVLYEMLVGRAAFPGETTSDTIAAILEREPAWERLPAAVPSSIRTLLARCLAKDPAERLRDIADTRFDIVDATSRRPRGVERRRALANKERLFWIAAALLGIAVAATIRFSRDERNASKAPLGVMEFGTRYPEGTIVGSGVAVAPDGRRAAVTTWPNQIWLYTFESSEWRQIPGTTGGRQPFWSPDGASIGFFDLHGTVWKVDVNGGPAVRLCDLGPNRLGGSGSWSTDGVVLFSAGQRLYRVPAAGGNPTQVMVADGGTVETSRMGPQFLADNRHFIYQAEIGGLGAAYVASLDGLSARRLVDTGYPPRFVAPAYLLFVRGTALFVQTLDPTTLAVGGQPQIVAQNVSPGSLEDWPLFSASSSVLAFVHPGVGNLVWFDRAGTRLGAISNPVGAEYLNPAISPTDDAIAVNAIDPQTGNWDIWIVDKPRGVASRFTSDAARDVDPVWSPDGKDIVFGSDRGPHPGVYRKRVGGSEPEALLATIDGHFAVTDWSPDGQTLLVTRNASLWGLRLGGDRQLFPIRAAPFAEYSARLSPDGHWIAYLSNESGIYEVYVQRFLEPGERKQVSSGGAIQPRWTKDGRELVYPTRAGELMAVSLDFNGSSVRVGAAQPLMLPRVVPVLDSRNHYDVMRDGQRFLVRQTEGQRAAELRVTLNWTEKLKR